MPKPIITNFIPSSPSPTEEDDGLLVFAAIGQDVVTHSANRALAGKMPTSRRCKTPDPRGYRKQFTFWLDGGNDWHLNMGKWLMDLKTRRQFAPTVRNALALYRELREGRVDLLLEWFPWIKDCFASPLPAAPDMDALHRKIELLERLVLAQQGGAQPAAKPSLNSTGIAPATLPAPPVDDEDTLIVSIDQDAGSRSAANFIKSAFALQGEKYQ